MQRQPFVGVLMFFGVFGHHRAEDKERTADIGERLLFSRPHLSRDAAGLGILMSLEFDKCQLQGRFLGTLTGKK